MQNGQIIKKAKDVGIVEIILLCQNDLEVTQKCLEFLYRHTNNFSVVFIDNASSDGSFDFLKKFAENNDNFTLVRNKTDVGCIPGRNLGYKISCDLDHEPKYICFLDNDQFVSKGWLQRHLAVMERGYDIVGAEAWLIHPTTLLPVRHNTRLDQEFSYVGCGGMMIKRTVIEDIGLFDEDLGLSHFEDPLLNFFAHESGYNIGWNIKHGIRHEQQTNVATNEEKRRRFLFAYEVFKKKWSGKTVPRMLQVHLDIFDL